MGTTVRWCTIHNDVQSHDLLLQRRKEKEEKIGVDLRVEEDPVIRKARHRHETEHRHRILVRP